MIKNLMKSIGLILGITTSQYIIVSIATIIFSLFYQGPLEEFLNTLWFKNMTLVVSIMFTLFMIFILTKNKKDDSLSFKKIMLSFFGGIIFSLIFHLIRNIFDPISKETFSILLLIETGILGPILEELMFRKMIYGWMKQVSSTKTAMLLTTFLFAFSHSGFMNIIYAFALGYILIGLYHESNSLKSPIAFHIGTNIFALLFTFF